MRYEEVFLYADDNGVLKKCLLDGYAAGVCVCVCCNPVSSAGDDH